MLNINDCKKAALQVIVGIESFQSLQDEEKRAYLAFLGLDEGYLSELRHTFFQTINGVEFTGTRQDVMYASIKMFLDTGGLDNTGTINDVEKKFWCGIADGTLLLGGLRVYQDRCITLSGINDAMTAVDQDFLDNRIVRFTGTGTGAVAMAALPKAPFGARIQVFNHNMLPITVESSRVTSVEYAGGVTTSAPYFDVVVNTEDVDSTFKNVVVIGSD